MNACEWCGNQLTEEEIEYPATDGFGRKIDGTICDECFHEHYEWACDRCQNYEYEEFHGIWLVVFEAVHVQGDWRSEDREAEPGIYEITKWPYFGGPIIGELSLYGGALRRTKAKIDFPQGHYPCGHLCRECAKELHLRHSKSGREFHERRLTSEKVT